MRGSNARSQTRALIDLAVMLPLLFEYRGLCAGIGTVIVQACKQVENSFGRCDSDVWLTATF
ncbi:MAG: hypothetical protein KDH90_17345 [Anaerolineae bacterium]|nr:hypothetical protein [Anaerolineae bacterium]